MTDPKHIGFIVDGNRRYAKNQGKNPWEGHHHGVERLKEILEACKEFGITTVTLYTFSVQNFGRSKFEVDYLFNMFREKANEVLSDKEFLDNKHGVCVKFIGRLEMFPKDMQELMGKIVDHTKNNKKYKLNFAMGYGGREEVIDAVKKISQQVKDGKIKVEDINEEVVAENLYIKDEPDMIIRTGGVSRTSNFLIWQSHYTEWFFIEKMFPDFTKEDLKSCIEQFKQRERRFGK